MCFPRHLKCGNGQELGVAQDAVDVQDKSELLAELAHSEEVLQTNTGAKRGSLFDIVGSEIDDLVDSVSDDSHHRLLGILFYLQDDNAGGLGNWASWESKTHAQIDNWNNVAAKVDDAANPLRHLGHLGDRGVLDDFLYTLDVDCIFFVS